MLAGFPELPRRAYRSGATERWRDDPAGLDAWKEGRTGVSIVDAGMRQLVAEGFMHNRARLVTASYWRRVAGVPTASRPHMPDYGVAAPSEGSGLLPWSWAAERLERSHDYWVATIHPDGRPNVTPVWGVWDGEAVWFSCGPRSRKARNLDRDPRATVTTSDADEPVILEGTAVREPGRAANEALAERVNAKYGGAITTEFLLGNATYRFTPSWAMGLVEADFSGSPTRWTFS